MMMEFFIFWTLLTLVVAWISNAFYEKSFWKYFWLSFFLSPAIGLIVLILKTKDSRKKCPKCAEAIKKEALVCRFCGFSFDEKKDVAAKVTYEMFDEARIKHQNGLISTEEYQKISNAYLGR